MRLSFLKMHANGDDFAMVDLRGRDESIDGKLAKLLAIAIEE